MPNKMSNPERTSLGALTKRCYFAGRAMMEHALRPHGLGATQWYVLYQLAEIGPTMQRELVRVLQIERATLSTIIGSLVGKGLVEQVPDAADQRQKLLRLTPIGERLWADLPDLRFIHDAAFADISEAEIEITARVLRTATERLNQRMKEE
jgi:MarR family transcriptional regulator, lower aerobic nicotinate degradation pathway regulator